MSFSDDDLKRLKAHITIPKRRKLAPNLFSSIEKLLARLEAAEKCLAFHFDATDCQCEKCITWRKAKGE